MASLAVSLALATERVTTDIIEANEFAEVSERYQVRGVPTTVINDSAIVVGAVPPGHFLEQLREVFEPPQGEDAE